MTSILTTGRRRGERKKKIWVPAFAGMTIKARMTMMAAMTSAG